VKPIADPIKDTQDSFLTGLFQFRRAREQFCGWNSITYIAKHQAAYRDIDSDDDTDMDDANEWKSIKIDLFRDFEEIDIREIKAWAENVWSAPNVTIESQIGQSETYDPRDQTNDRYKRSRLIREIKRTIATTTLKEPLDPRDQTNDRYNNVEANEKNDQLI
jgi:hypothetical protein